jgi:hypothetical protein
LLRQLHLPPVEGCTVLPGMVIKRQRGRQLATLRTPSGLDPEGQQTGQEANDERCDHSGHHEVLRHESKQSPRQP